MDTNIPTVDAEFHALVPPLTSQERKQLEENLRADGCRDPLVIWNGILLDGHNRLEICQAHSIPFRTVEHPCADREEAQTWIIYNQLGRRNLTDFARAELALKFEKVFEQQAHKRIVAGRGADGSGGRGRKKTPVADSSQGLRTRTRLAKVARVSEDTIRKSKRIIQQADDNTKAKVRLGEMSINEAYQKVSPPVKDPLDTLPEAREHAPEDDESKGLSNLKKAWNNATKKDRAAFIEWINQHGAPNKENA
jgi:hypothetical protein